MSIESLEHMVRSRVRVFLRHTWLVTVLGTILLGAAVWAGFYYTTQADHMRIAAGPVDSKFVQALSSQIAKSHRNFTLQIVRTQQSKETAQAISKGDADLAILPSNLDDSVNWPAVAILRQNVMALMIPAAVAASKAPASASTAGAASAKGGGSKTASAGKGATNSKTAKSAKSAKSAKNDDSDDSDTSDDSDDSGKFAKVPQLSGKRIGIVTGNEATAGLLELVLSHYGVSLDKVKISRIDPNSIADAVKNNQIDALFVAGAATGRDISNAVAAATVNGKAPTFVEIDQADGIAKRNPAFDSVDIDAGTFGGNPPSPSDSLKTLSFAELLVARKTYSDSVIGSLAKIIYSSRQAFAAALPGDVKITAPSTDKDADITVHSGALAYLSDSQQSFFDKYGDDIFYGMLIFPVFGSAIAGLATYLRSDGRTRRLRLLQRVLDLVRKAHAAQTLEAIEHLQIDADNLVIAIIHQGEHEEFDETVRMSFAFALDQLRFT
ncbi:MAG: TAXI family TRAP transporter solute-binding subunit, partial [Xanthobacteraceae bacterium]